MKNLFLPVIAACVIFCAYIFCPGTADALEGKVIKTVNGDTITILTADRQQVKIRFYGIDCPERRQPFGNRAKDFTTRELAGKIAQVEEMDKDRYGRIVGIVRTGSGESINEKLLKNGLAWIYERYCKIPQCSQWQKIEENSIKNKIGLFQDKNALPPWKWRKIKK